MGLGFFLLQAAGISLTGVMAPGPLSAVTVAKGTESPHAGALVALGHAVVEFPLMLLLFLGFGLMLDKPGVRIGIGFAGGLFLLVMAAGMFRSSVSSEKNSKNYGSPFLSGIFLSAGNPYFLLWWATAGAALIMESLRFGWAGFASLTALHWMCDFFWCYFLSIVSFRGGSFFGRSFQRVLFFLCGGFLLVFGLRFIYDAVKTALTHW